MADYYFECNCPGCYLDECLEERCQLYCDCSFCYYFEDCPLEFYNLECSRFKDTVSGGEVIL